MSLLCIFDLLRRWEKVFFLHIINHQRENWVECLANICHGNLWNTRFARLEGHSQTTLARGGKLLGQQSCSVSNSYQRGALFWQSMIVVAILYKFVYEFRGNNTYIILVKTALAKGQTISEWIYEVIVSHIIWNKYCKDFCPVLCHTTNFLSTLKDFCGHCQKLSI